MMKTGFAFCFILFVGLCNCAAKSPQTTDAKKDTKVISVFDEPAKPTEAAPASSAPAAPAATTEAPKATETPAVAGNNDSPKEVIKSYTAELRSLRNDENVKKKKRDRQISEKVRKFFDFRSLAQMSLGSHWASLTPKKKDEFADLFTQLIEKSYLSKSKNLVGDYQLSYGNEVVNGNKATVACNIYKDDADFEITYELHKTANNWMIYNIVFDQVNLVKNYQSQFNKIIAKSNVDELMKTMRKKLNEGPSDVDAAL